MKRKVLIDFGMFIRYFREGDKIDVTDSGITFQLGDNIHIDELLEDNLPEVHKFITDDDNDHLGILYVREISHLYYKEEGWITHVSLALSNDQDEGERFYNDHFSPYHR